MSRAQDKLLNKLEESEPDPPTSQEDECVICINARATMQTSPCGHRVVCRRCFVKTIQSAVAQRMLPLRCVICRARVNRLTSSSGTWRIQESASTYSMGAKSWASVGGPANGMPTSSSTYSGFHSAPVQGRYSRTLNGSFAQSASLYSMSSTGSSTMSGISHISAYSKTSSISSGLCSPASPISPQSTSSYAHSSILNNHLAPPTTTPTISLSCSGSSMGSNFSPINLTRRLSTGQHSHHAGCPTGCSGAIPRKPLHTLNDTSSSSSSGPSYSPCYSSNMPQLATQSYPGRRYIKGRLVDLQNRLPPIKEFRSPAKVPHPSPVHISNPKFRYASYTKTSATEMAPLLKEPPSPPCRPMNIQVTTSLSNPGPSPLKAGGAKICPVVSKSALPKSAFASSKDKRHVNNINLKLNISSGKATNATTNTSTKTAGPVGGQKSLHDLHANAKSTKSATTTTAAATAATATAATTATTKVIVGAAKAKARPTTTATSSSKTISQYTSSSSRAFQLFSSSNHKEKADNKKNESMERKKKEEKLKLKAEKEARKEEKRLAKEEERLAKVFAKEEKRKVKKEAKELLLANDGNNKK